MAEEQNADTMIGTWILDQYRVVRVLAQGGMSCLYLAEQAAMDRFAAIKVLFPKVSKKPRLRSRFRQEARAASRLAHPNIVTVYNFGELPDGSLFLAMEYIDGASLGEMITDQRLSLPIALDICGQCAAALEHAHSKQVVHRDFKPENVMVTQIGGGFHVKVVDFGIARLTVDESGSDITQAGELIGTPRYLSPEQCRGEVAVAASDQYSFGLVLYELLAGRAPFEADSTLSYLRLHQHESPVPLATMGAELARFDPLVLRMLSKEVEDRFPEMGLVRQELERAFEHTRRMYSADTLQIDSSSREQPTQVLKKRHDTAGEREVRHIALVGEVSSLSDKDYQNLRQGAIFHVPVQLDRYRTPDEVRSGDTPPAMSVVLFRSDNWLEASNASSLYADLSPMLAHIDVRLSDRRLDAAGERFRHVLAGPRPIDPVVLAVTAGYVLSNERGGIERLFAEHPVQRLRVGSLAAKSPAVDALLAAARDAGVRRQTLHSLAELAEELLMNAILHSPDTRQSSSGDVQLPSGKEANLCWVMGERFVGVSVQDSFGALTARDVLSRVTGAAPPAELDREAAGAGMGLRIMSHAVRHLFFAISPGAWCEILALVERDPVGIEERTVCVLQGLGQSTIKLGNRLMMSQRREGDRTCIQLRGEINETSDLKPVFRHPGPVYLDLEGVERINSIGLRNIVDAARAAPRDLELFVERCSEAWVRQMSMIPALAEMGELCSILAPYCCRKCSKETLELLTAEQLREQLPPECHCVACGEPMRFDAHPSEYFAFMAPRDQDREP